MPTILGYTSLKEALESQGVTYELEIVEDNGDKSYRPKVSARLHINKEYYLDKWYGLSVPLEIIQSVVEQELAKKYRIYSTTVWTS